jgi:hypothetical protein
MDQFRITILGRNDTLNRWLSQPIVNGKYPKMVRHECYGGIRIIADVKLEVRLWELKFGACHDWHISFYWQGQR